MLSFYCLLLFVLFEQPSGSPTETPSKFPTESPTPAPTLSLSPTEFVPEVVELLSESSRSATVLRAAYFEVTTGAEWAKIVNLKIWTYKTKGLQVYVKDGEATNYEQVPCSWKRIAETSANWNPGYWKKVRWPALCRRLDMPRKEWQY